MSQEEGGLISDSGGSERGAEARKLSIRDEGLKIFKGVFLDSLHSGEGVMERDQCGN